MKEETGLVCTMGLTFYTRIIIDYNIESFELAPQTIYF